MKRTLDDEIETTRKALRAVEVAIDERHPWGDVEQLTAAALRGQLRGLQAQVIALLEEKIAEIEKG